MSHFKRKEDRDKIILSRSSLRSTLNGKTGTQNPLAAHSDRYLASSTTLDCKVLSKSASVLAWYFCPNP